MSGLFGGGPKPPDQQTPQITSKQVDESASNAAQFEKLRQAAAFGKQKTMLTAGMDLGNAPVRRKTLLGGGA